MMMMMKKPFTDFYGVIRNVAPSSGTGKSVGYQQVYFGFEKQRVSNAGKQKRKTA